VILTKHVHACFTLEKDGATLVVDPGAFSEPTRVLRGAAAVLITHDHVDHLDQDAVRGAGVPVYAHPDVLAQLPDVEGVPVRPGDTVDAAGFAVRVFGGRHAHIHEDVPDLANNAYLIDERVYYAGDAFSVPGVPVEVLFVPIGGPWLKIAESIDFVRAVAPTRAHPTHDGLLTEPGRLLCDNWLAQRGGADYARLEDPVEL
jgi:L-ascorbate metabolism protein UlaG (beta-lactamase superfamily)